MEWRTIDTIPDEIREAAADIDKPVLIWDGRRAGEARWSPLFPTSGHGGFWYWTWDFEQPEPVAATHWKPMPGRPISSEEDEARIASAHNDALASGAVPMSPGHAAALIGMITKRSGGSLCCWHWLLAEDGTISAAGYDPEVHAMIGGYSIARTEFCETNGACAALAEIEFREVYDALAFM